MTPPDLASWLRRHKDDGAVLTLNRDTVQSLHDELRRLQQSSDRMRKQNSKLRKRMAKLKGGSDEDVAAADGEDR